jgi:hypothetical protein
MALEETGSRVLAAQVAGTIALWSQLHTFEDGPPEVMAWIALLLFIGSLCFLGFFLRPRRLVRFWDRAIPDEVFAVKRSITPEEEGTIVEHISTAMRGQRDSLERAIRVSLPLGVLALSLTAIAYAIEKRWYAP